MRWHPQQEVLFSCSYDDTIKAGRSILFLWQLMATALVFAAV